MSFSDQSAGVPSAGVVFGTIYRRSGNLRLSILSHAISNATLGGYIIANNDWSLW